jgi:hypothetical protein
MQSDGSGRSFSHINNANSGYAWFRSSSGPPPISLDSSLNFLSGLTIKVVERYETTENVDFLKGLGWNGM